MPRLDLELQLQRHADQNWYQRFEVIAGSGVYTPGWASIDSTSRLRSVGLTPEALKGKRVLDVGADAGAFSFFMEECGAQVVALDPFDPNRNGFNIVKSIRKSNVEHRLNTVYDLNPLEFGRFDIVAIYAVLMMLKHPLLALERIRSVCNTDTLLVGEISSLDSWFPVADLQAPGANLEGITRRRVRSSRLLSAESVNQLPLCGFTSPTQFQTNTWFIPNSEALTRWLEVSGFSVELTHRYSVKLPTSGPATESHIGDPKSPRWATALKRGIQSVRNKLFKPRHGAGLTFRARCLGSAVREFEIPGMHHFDIPTRYELRVANDEITRLKQRDARP